ncbi:MAG TPA: outer membrane beta-barrel protein [Chitinivibrionales bacterium]|nr:outer membrane beta-barrel protein [Chitinivibrionales bacterium]
MKRNTTFLIVLFSSLMVFSAPQCRLAFNLGGTESFIDVTKLPQGLAINDSKWAGYFNFGMDGELDVNEYFGASLGIAFEKRGGTKVGNIQWGAFTVGSGEIEFNYRYFQIPLYLKGMLPLMIPGSVFICAGPELGVKIESEVVYRYYNNNASLIVNADSVTGPVDFGISGLVGYDLPIGWSSGLSLYCGYYYGFIDVYENKSQTSSDYNVYQRALKYGISFYVNFNTARR